MDQKTIADANWAEILERHMNELEKTPEQGNSPEQDYYHRTNQVINQFYAVANASEDEIKYIAVLIEPSNDELQKVNEIYSRRVTFSHNQYGAFVYIVHRTEKGEKEWLKRDLDQQIIKMLRDQDHQIIKMKQDLDQLIKVRKQLDEE
jgi:hypothetical protein